MNLFVQIAGITEIKCKTNYEKINLLCSFSEGRFTIFKDERGQFKIEGGG